jgi:myo-inositol-1-phosphate synthase
VIPIYLANDPAYVELYKKTSSLVFGDDGASGATPLTADLLEHLYERNRYVNFVVQFNIGGNTDFLALTIPEKNIMKETTKSSIVKDILGYDAPHYIKPTGFVDTIGDKKYVALHIEYYTFNGLKEELYVNYRINDSPSLAGLVVDLIRIGKWGLEKGYSGTLYPVNAFFMKKPGPLTARSISKINAYRLLMRLLGLEEDGELRIEEEDISL